MKITYPLPFLIATYRRSGAHLLMSLLNSTEKVGYIAEHLYPAQDARAKGESWSDAEVMTFFKERVYEVANHRESSSKHWGTKVDILDLFILERYLDLAKIIPQSMKWIWLRRKDKIKQAISLFRAEDTGIWRLADDSSPEEIEIAHSEVDIEVNQLYNIAVWNFLYDEAWRQFFEQNEITPHIIYYEDFEDERNWEKIIASIFDFLEVPYSRPLAVENDCLKQSTGKIPHAYKTVIEKLERFGIPLKYTDLDTRDEYELNLENR